MNRKRTRFDRLMLPTLAAGAVAGFASIAAAVPIGYVSGTYTQNFDSLANSGTSSTLPAGWAFLEVGTNGNTTYSAGTGSGTAGDTYSFGLAANTERAFGTLLSGTLNSIIGAEFQNDSGATITELTISYTGEQWRRGNTTLGAADRLNFGIGVGATGLNAGTFVDVDDLDFTSRNTAAAAATLDGNLSANKLAITKTITGLNITAGQVFWIRWADADLSPGSDDGLAIDDLSLATVGAPPPPPPPTPSTGPLFINEVDYDNIGTDNAEFIELAGVAGFYKNVQVQLINGATDTVYQTFNLPEFTLTDESGGYGFLVLAANLATVANADIDLTPDVDLVQNGAPDAIALLIDGVLVHYLSYEGNTAMLVNGQAPNDVTNLADSNTLAVSLQKVGTGSAFGDFTFDLIAPTPGAVNTRQTFAAPTSPVPEPATMGLLGIAGLALVRRRRMA